MIDLSQSEALERLADMVADRLRTKLDSELVETIVERVGERLGALELVDKYQLAERLNLSVPTIERAAKQGTIPSVKAARCRRFVVSEVIQAIKAAGRKLTETPDV